MHYEKPELIEIGSAEEVVLGSQKPNCSDANGTGSPEFSVDDELTD